MVQLRWRSVFIASMEVELLLRQFTPSITTEELYKVYFRLLALFILPSPLSSISIHVAHSRCEMPRVCRMQSGNALNCTAEPPAGLFSHSDNNYILGLSPRSGYIFSLHDPRISRFTLSVTFSKMWIVSYLIVYFAALIGDIQGLYFNSSSNSTSIPAVCSGFCALYEGSVRVMYFPEMPNKNSTVSSTAEIVTAISDGFTL